MDGDNKLQKEDVRRKLDAYVTVKSQFEKQMDILDSNPVLMNKNSAEVNKLEDTVKLQLKNLQQLHSQRENFENDVIRISEPEPNIPLLNLEKVNPNFGSRSINIFSQEIAENENMPNTLSNPVSIESTLRNLKSNRSLEQEELQSLNLSFIQYEKLYKKLQLEVHQLTRKVLELQKVSYDKDDKIRSLEETVLNLQQEIEKRK